MNNKLIGMLVGVTVGIILCSVVLMPAIDSASYSHTEYENENYTYLATTHLKEPTTYSIDSSKNLLANGEIVALASAHSAGVSAPTYGFQSHDDSAAWAFVQSTSSLTSTSASLSPSGSFTLTPELQGQSTKYIAASSDGELAAYSLHEGAATFHVTEGHKVIVSANYSQDSNSVPLAWRATIVGETVSVDYATLFDTAEGSPIEGFEVTISPSTTITTEDGVTTYEDFNITFSGVSAASRVVAFVEKDYQDSIEKGHELTALYFAIPVLVIISLVLVAASTIRRY